MLLDVESTTEQLIPQNTETDECLPTTLRGLQGLRSLDLWNASITGPGLAALAETPRLDSLILNETPITDAGLEHLRLVPEQSHLELNETSIADAGLEHLRQLVVRGCPAVSDEGVTSLRQALPNCRISR